MDGHPSLPQHRWRLAVIAAVGATLLAHAPAFCASDLLQHGYATVNTAARILLPLIAPAFIDLMPAEGLAVLAARVPAPGRQTAAEADAAAAQCTAYQATSVLLGCSALAWQLRRAERQQRKARLAVTAGQPRAVVAC